MLDKKSKQFLKNLNLISDGKKTNSLPLALGYFAVEDFIESLHYDMKTAEWVASYLEEKGYIDIMQIDGFLAVKPTYSGKNYNEFEMNELKDFYLKSIVTPIFVSCITAIIISFLL